MPIQCAFPSLVFSASLAACVGLLGLAAPAQAQLGKKRDPPAQAPAPPATPAAAHSFLDDLFANKGRTHDWVLKVNIHVDSYQENVVYANPTAPSNAKPSGKMPEYVPFKFDAASVIFPAMRETAGSTLMSDPTATLRMDGRLVANEATSFLENLPCGARYGKWELKNLEGRQLDFDIDVPVTCRELFFNDAAAAKAVWPKSAKWPAAAASSFTPTQMGIDLRSPIIGQTVAAWCSGKSPQSIPPVQLAKFFASRVLEEIQPSGDGTISSRTGLLQGFALPGVDYTLTQKRGSEHDIACTLCALYLAAGLPARIVIGYDVSESKGEDSGLARRKGGKLRSWVEFAIMDEMAKTAAGEPRIAWIPVDVVRQRKSGNRAPALDKPWKFFGNNDETDDVIPIAFHYHPPTTVVAHGSPCFWGWITFPEIQQGAEQMVRFQTITAPKTVAPRGGGNR